MTVTKLHLVCAWLCLAALISATSPALVHEARQGPISITTPATDPGPESIQTPSSTSTSLETTETPTTTTDTPAATPTTTMPPAPATPTPSHTPASSSSSSSSSPDTLTSPSPSPQSSSSAPQPSSTSSAGRLDFAVQNMTTCNPGLISWQYSGQDAPLLLSITNNGLPEMYRVQAKQDTVNAAIQQQLADTYTSAQSWTWSPVNLTQGWYEIQGVVSLSSSSLHNDSAPFFISNGTDVSCLATVSPPQASSITVSPTATVVPLPAASKPHVASIAGGVVGGVIGAILVIVTGIWLWLRRRKTSFVGQGGRKDGAWGSLKSTSSSIHPGSNGAQFANHHHSESTGAILQDSVGGKASARTTPVGSDEDVIVVNEEKLVSPASSSGMSPFDALNTPVHYDRRASAYSVQTPTTAAASDPFRSRAPSVRSSNQSLEQQAQRIRSSMETSNRRRSDRLSMPTLPGPGLSRIPPSPTQTQVREEYPLTTIAPTPVNRSISAGAVSMTARRTSRKPVPQYDSSLLLEDNNTDSVSTFTAGAESSQSHGTGAHGTASRLVHKASFGDGRPMHYLIPDMPPSQQG